MPRRAGQTPLTRERILEAALALIDEDGLHALSMRRLANALDVDPMAIYHYLPSKGALIHSLVRHVLAAMPKPSDQGEWRERVRAWARSYRTTAHAHPNLVLQIVADPEAVAIAAGEANTSLTSALTDAGISPIDAARCADVIVDYVNGSALAARVPGTHQTQLAKGFEFGLDVILKGCGTLRRASGSSVRRRQQLTKT